MSTTQPPTGFDELSVEEQIRYVNELWERISSRTEAVPIPDWHREVLSERLRQHDAAPDNVKPWDEVRERIRERLRGVFHARPITVPWRGSLQDHHPLARASDHNIIGPKGRSALTLDFSTEPVPLFLRDGVAFITGTRVPLDTVVYAFREGATPEEIVQRYTLLRHRPSIDVVRVQDMELAGHADEEVLARAAEEGRIVLTHEVATVAKHAYDRIRAGQPMAGVVEVSAGLAIGRAVEDLLLLYDRSVPGEWNHLSSPVGGTRLITW